MAEDRDDRSREPQDQDNQQPTGQQRDKSAFGQGQQSEAHDSARNSGQPIGGNDSNIGSGTTLTQAGGSDIGSSGQGSGIDPSRQAQGSGGEGFIGSKAGGSDNTVQQGGTGGLPGDASSASSANATGGTDFARQGRGSSDNDDEKDGNSSGGSDSSR